MTESVESPERIWIDSEGGCPYFYYEDELSYVGCPVTEYVRADTLRAEIEAMRAHDAAKALLAKGNGNDHQG